MNIACFVKDFVSQIIENNIMKERSRFTNVLGILSKFGLHEVARPRATRANPEFQEQPNQSCNSIFHSKAFSACFFIANLKFESCFQLVVLGKEELAEK